MNRDRAIAVLVVVVLGGGVILVSTRDWATIALAGERALTVTGQQASPGVAPVGVVLLALAAALAIGGSVAARVLGALLVVLAAALAALTAPMLADPVGASRGAITQASGVAGSGVRDLAGAAAVTPWPGVGLGLAVLIAVAGVLVIARASRWRRTSRRYSSPTGRVVDPTDPVDAWDALTGGADPTGPRD